MSISKVRPSGAKSPVSSLGVGRDDSDLTGTNGAVVNTSSNGPAIGKDLASEMAVAPSGDGPLALSTDPAPAFDTRLIEAKGPVLPFQTGGGAADQYRLIRTRIVQHPQQPRVVLVTSPGPGDGKTLNAINVAGILSLGQDTNVLLIGGDLNSDISSELGLSPSPGLSNVLSGQCRLQRTIIRAAQYPNLYILPCGTNRQDMPELLDSPMWQSLIEYCRASFRYVVIDGPPCGLVVDYYLLEAVSDAIAVVVRPDHTNRGMLKNVLAEVPKHKFLGVVLNCFEDWLFWKRYEYGRPWE